MTFDRARDGLTPLATGPRKNEAPAERLRDDVFVTEPTLHATRAAAVDAASGIGKANR